MCYVPIVSSLLNEKQLLLVAQVLISASGEEYVSC